MSINCVFLH